VIFSEKRREPWREKSDGSAMAVPISFNRMLVKRFPNLAHLVSRIALLRM
jgi:hypothetical protein